MPEAHQKGSSFEVPILFLIYNRPDHAPRVFDRIRGVRPTQLYIAADGPDPQRPNDPERCRKTRSIVDMVDWSCDVKILFRDTNLGCKRAVSSAISWFFEHVEEGIILEDDCLPDPSFFPYVKELLERYRDSASIASISGYNPLTTPPTTDSSYTFSRYPFIWGWGTWRRAWDGYTTELPPLDDTMQKMIGANSSSLRMRKIWEYNYLHTRNGTIDTWDYQFLFKNWREGKVSVVPKHSPISNIGIGSESTNTIFAPSSMTFESKPLQFPLKHPTTLEPIPEVEVALEATRRRSWLFVVTLKCFPLLKWLGVPNLFRLIKKLMNA